MEEALGQMKDGVGFLEALIIQYGLNTVIAIVILIVGFWIASWFGAFVTSRMKKAPRVDETLSNFIGSLARYVVIAIVIIAVLNRFGVQTASLVALIGAAGLAIGLALQGTLSNLAAGVMLILFRPFKIGDYVEAGGSAGTIKEVGLFVTELATVDNVQIIVPNGKVWGDTITNFSAHKERRVDLVFGVGYGANLKTAEEAIRGVIGADARILDAPAAPFVMVTNLGDSSVDFTVRVWCKASDYWGLKFDLTRAVKERFDAEGVDIPFPTTTIVQASAG